MSLHARLLAVGTASLFEAAGKSGAMDARIKPRGGSLRLAGRAMPVRVGPGDNLALHRLLSGPRTGDVIVVDAGGRCDVAVWGDVLSAAARGAGYRGLVVDGAIRDAGAIEPERFAIFAKGVAIPGPVKAVAGTVGERVTCGGVQVRAGDWIVGDADGVVVVPAETADGIADRAAQREREESAMIARLLAGQTTTVEELGLTQVSA